MELVKKYIELKKKEKEIKEELQNVWALLIDNIEDAVEQDWYKISKWIRMSYKIKEDISEQEVIDKFPDAVDLKLNTKKISKLPDAKKYLEVEEKEYLSVRKIKDVI